MAGKRVNSKDCSFDNVHYNVETRSLYFRSKAGKSGLIFLGVPADVFYGMPSGANLENFIALKLSGRFSRVEVPAPPLVWYSRTEATCYISHQGFQKAYKTRPGEPTSMPEHADEAFALFSRTYANREPDSIEAEAAE